jgi:hypothetical protein
MPDGAARPTSGRGGTGSPGRCGRGMGRSGGGYGMSSSGHTPTALGVANRQSRFTTSTTRGRVIPVSMTGTRSSRCVSRVTARRRAPAVEQSARRAHARAPRATRAPRDDRNRHELASSTVGGLVAQLWPERAITGPRDRKLPLVHFGGLRRRGTQSAQVSEVAVDRGDGHLFRGHSRSKAGHVVRLQHRCPIPTRRNPRTWGIRDNSVTD